MASLKNFGQYVSLEIKDVNGVEVLSTDSLRIDFDVREMYSFSRCKITVFNLTSKVSKSIASGENYATVKVGLHGEEPFVIVDNMFVSNSVSTRVVPNIMTYLYCFSKLRKDVLEKQVSVLVKKPTVEKMIRELMVAGGLKREPDFRYFPAEVLDYIPRKATARLEGSVLSNMERLSVEYKFKYYVIGDSIRIGYIVDNANFEATDLSTSDGSILLDSVNMRSNPKLGPASLHIDSNLDPRIKPMEKLDVRKLITAELTGITDLRLSTAERLVIDTVANRSLYQVLFVQNIGSNWSREWSTKAQAVTPTEGVNMPTTQTTWFR